MVKRLVSTFGLATLFACSAFAQDAKTVIDNATKTMGSLKSVEYSGSGFDFAIGQNVNPTQPWPKFIDKTYKRSMNFDTPAYRMERIRVQGENPHVAAASSRSSVSRRRINLSSLRQIRHGSSSWSFG